jgi:hypothetical protein
MKETTPAVAKDKPNEKNAALTNPKKNMFWGLRGRCDLAKIKSTNRALPEAENDLPKLAQPQEKLRL